MYFRRNFTKMNDTIQIKNNLISRINDSDDLDFLRTIQTLFDSSGLSLFELSEAQEESIEKGRDQIKKGNFKEHEQVILDLKAWLKSK